MVQPCSPCSCILLTVVLCSGCVMLLGSTSLLVPASQSLQQQQQQQHHAVSPRLVRINAGGGHVPAAVALARGPPADPGQRCPKVGAFVPNVKPREYGDLCLDPLTIGVEAWMWATRTPRVVTALVLESHNRTSSPYSLHLVTRDATVVECHIVDTRGNIVHIVESDVTMPGDWSIASCGWDCTWQPAGAGSDGSSSSSSSSSEGRRQRASAVCKIWVGVKPGPHSDLHVVATAATTLDWPSQPEAATRFALVLMPDFPAPGLLHDVAVWATGDRSRIFHNRAVNSWNVLEANLAAQAHTHLMAFLPLLTATPSGVTMDDFHRGRGVVLPPDLLRLYGFEQPPKDVAPYPARPDVEGTDHAALRGDIRHCVARLDMESQWGPSLATRDMTDPRRLFSQVPYLWCLAQHHTVRTAAVQFEFTGRTASMLVRAWQKRSPGRYPHQQHIHGTSTQPADGISSSSGTSSSSSGSSSGSDNKDASTAAAAAAAVGAEGSGVSASHDDGAAHNVDIGSSGVPDFLQPEAVLKRSHVMAFAPSPSWFSAATETLSQHPAWPVTVTPLHGITFTEEVGVMKGPAVQLCQHSPVDIVLFAASGTAWYAHTAAGTHELGSEEAEQEPKTETRCCGELVAYLAVCQPRYVVLSHNSIDDRMQRRGPYHHMATHPRYHIMFEGFSRGSGYSPARFQPRDWSIWVRRNFVPKYAPLEPPYEPTYPDLRGCKAEHGRDCSHPAIFFAWKRLVDRGARPFPRYVLAEERYTLQPGVYIVTQPIVLGPGSVLRADALGSVVLVASPTFGLGAGGSSSSSGGGGGGGGGGTPGASWLPLIHVQQRVRVDRTRVGIGSVDAEQSAQRQEESEQGEQGQAWTPYGDAQPTGADFTPSVPLDQANLGTAAVGATGAGGTAAGAEGGTGGVAGAAGAAAGDQGLGGGGGGGAQPAARGGAGAAAGAGAGVAAAAGAAGGALSAGAATTGTAATGASAAPVVAAATAPAAAGAEQQQGVVVIENLRLDGNNYTAHVGVAFIGTEVSSGAADSDAQEAATGGGGGGGGGDAGDSIGDVLGGGLPRAHVAASSVNSVRVHACSFKGFRTHGILLSDLDSASIELSHVQDIGYPGLLTGSWSLRQRDLVATTQHAHLVQRRHGIVLQRVRSGKVVTSTATNLRFGSGVALVESGSVRVQQCSFALVRQFGVLVQRPREAIVIDSCSAEHTAYLLAVREASTSPGAGVTLSGCTASWLHGLALLRGASLHSSHNMLRGAWRGAFAVQGGHNELHSVGDTFHDINVLAPGAVVQLAAPTVQLEDAEADAVLAPAGPYGPVDVASRGRLAANGVPLAEVDGAIDPSQRVDDGVRPVAASGKPGKAAVKGMEHLSAAPYSPVLYMYSTALAVLSTPMSRIKAVFGGKAALGPVSVELEWSDGTLPSPPSTGAAAGTAGDGGHLTVCDEWCTASCAKCDYSLGAAEAPGSVSVTRLVALLVVIAGSTVCAIYFVVQFRRHAAAVRDKYTA